MPAARLGPEWLEKFQAALLVIARDSYGEGELHPPHCFGQCNCAQLFAKAVLTTALENLVADHA